MGPSPQHRRQDGDPVPTGSLDAEDDENQQLRLLEMWSFFRTHVSKREMGQEEEK